MLSDTTINLGPYMLAGFVVCVVVFSVLGVYNRLVQLRNLTSESWRDVDTELQRRYDLIPNLVNTVKGYAAHELQVFESVTSLRTAAMQAQRTAAAQSQTEGALGSAVSGLMAVAENYPDLEASDSFLALQRELVDTENRIQVARRVYNANVRRYNTLVQAFPSLIIARFGHFDAAAYFEPDSVAVVAVPSARI
jgi:LemA protein